MPTPDQNDQLQTLPQNLHYAFCPAYDFANNIQEIRIIIDGLDGYIPTGLAVHNLAEAEDLCDRFNQPLGFTRNSWTKMVARTMFAARERNPHDYLH